MSATGDISDRHARTVEGLGDTLKPLRVLLVAGPAFALPGGQHLMVCLVNLLCRMVGSVAAIEIDVPDTKLSVATPFVLAEGDPVSQLAELARLAVGDDVPVASRTGVGCDMIVCVGEPPQHLPRPADLFALGAGWRAWVGTGDYRPQEPPGGDRNPLGPYLAASLAAGEVFKRSRGLVRGRHAKNFGYSLWSGETGSWEDLADGAPVAGLDLAPFYLVGAGAVGQGLLAVLAAADVGSAYIVTIDDDRHDKTNLNRCFVAGVADEGKPKIEAMGRARRAAGLDGREFGGTLNQYISRGPDDFLRADLAALEANDEYRLVVSAVDKNVSRHDIQGLSPGLVLGASTIGLSAKANVYDMTAGTACLACHNRPENDGERLREVEQLARAMDDTALREFLEGGVDDVEAVLAYLRRAPHCGELAEADFRNFATRRSPLFSVSFVSMGAALLMAARIFSRATSLGEPGNRGLMSTISFRNLDAGDDNLAQDLSCSRCERAGRLLAHST